MHFTLIRLIIYVFYSFTRTFATIYIRLLFTRPVVTVNVSLSSFRRAMQLSQRKHCVLGIPGEGKELKINIKDGSWTMWINDKQKIIFTLSVLRF